MTTAAITGNKVYGIGAQFPNTAALLHAAEKIRDAGYKKWDVFSPFPVHGMDAAMGLGNSKVSVLSLIGGITGLLTAFLLQVIPSVFLYPMVVAGKPFLSLPAFFPIMFELTILFCAFATVFGMLGINRLPRLNHPSFNWDLLQKSTDDGFFVVIEAEDTNFSESATRDLLQTLCASDITVINHDDEA
ncbi:MAG: DUF3341 domain-containing protein [Verrucomicrobiota bacterium]|nr:DUF3341 domain-containing protein [Verrucomicrobiota bacterium]